MSTLFTPRLEPCVPVVPERASRREKEADGLFFVKPSSPQERKSEKKLNATPPSRKGVPNKFKWQSSRRSFAGSHRSVTAAAQTLRGVTSTILPLELCAPVVRRQASRRRGGRKRSRRLLFRALMPQTGIRLKALIASSKKKIEFIGPRIGRR